MHIAKDKRKSDREVSVFFLIVLLMIFGQIDDVIKTTGICATAGIGTNLFLAKVALDILAKHNVKVTFFMTGGWVKSYPDDVKAILAAGHDLGNHSENHKHMSQLSTADQKEELMKVHEKVKELTDYEMFLFRPPYGDYDNAVVGTLRECGHYTIQWDVESQATASSSCCT